MSDKVCLVNQSSGLGDIIFCQRIGEVWCDAGYDVIWPTDSAHRDSALRLKSSEYIDYVDPELPFVRDDLFYSNGRERGYSHTSVPIQEDNFIYLPLNQAYQCVFGPDRPYHSGFDWSEFSIHPVMECKYRMCSLDYRGWQDLDFVRDLEKENALMDHLEISPGEEYILVNRFFSTGGAHKIDLGVPTDVRVVDMGIIDGYCLFDWYQVIQNATSFHTPHSSHCYMVEMMDWSTLGDLYVYPRLPYQDKKDLDMVMSIFDAPWRVWNGN